MSINGYQFSRQSVGNMKGLHPDMVRVLHRALEITPYDFGVLEGVRSIERQREYFRNGNSTTMNSQHLIQDTGFGHAVDLVVWVDGKPTQKHKYFRKVIQAIFTAAIDLGVQVEAGALWRDFLDSAHIQLNPRYYAKSY